jgi:AcrR family transcriptional regulator
MSDVDKRQRVEEAILLAAAEAIATRGFHGMSMRELAKATGRSLSSFYNYFESKHEVLFALHSRAFETLTRTASEVLERDDDPAAQLYLFIANHVGYFVQHTDVMRVLVHEGAVLDGSQKDHVRELKQNYFDVARTIVQAVLKKNAPARADDAAEVERATYSVFGMLNWVYAWYEPKRHGKPSDVAHTVHRMAVHGLYGGEDPAELQRRMDRLIRQGELPSPVRRPDDEGRAA